MKAEPADGMRVFVYRNLNKGRGDRPVFSVQAREAIETPQGIIPYGRVFHHTQKITLRDCEFRVQAAGYNRTLRENVKNVHAGIVGRIVIDPAPQNGGIEVMYNPYFREAFTDDYGNVMTTAPLVTVGSEQRGPGWRSQILIFF